jgi:Cu2+-exporting ATPase
MTTTAPSHLPEEWAPAWREAAERGECLHCGNGLGRFWKVGDGPFCCRGCRGVWEMINEADLCRFYDLAQDNLAPAPVLRPDTFAWLDRVYAERPEGATGQLALDLDIQGVHCAACVWLIEELFKRQPGGILLRINPTLGKVELVWDLDRGDLRTFLTEIERFGYRLGPGTRGGRRQSRALLMRMAISIAMALNVMMFSLSFYFGLAGGALHTFFGWLSLGMATISLLAGGGVFLRGAIAGLRRRVLHLDVPISLGMILAWAGSTYGFLTGGPDHAYFDSLTVFIALMLVGRWAQEHILERNRNSLLESSGAENLTARRVRHGEIEAVPAADLVQGDELWIAPGDLAPVEGIVMRRAAEVSLDWITGESDVVTVQPGDKAPAGAFNAARHGFTMTAVEDFGQSRLNDLLRTSTVSDEEFRPRWWHLVSTWYVAAVLAVAVLGFALWVGRDATMALRVTIAILVVTCPCALGLATPLAEELVHHGLRKAGIFLRKHSFMEKALSVRRILLDKTGTLTMGHLVLAAGSREALLALTVPERTVLAHLTARSNHPVSRCLNAALDGMPLEARDFGAAGEELTESPGLGIEWILDGTTWRLGRSDFALGRGEPDGRTVFARDGEQVAAFTFAEEIKADAAGEIAALEAEGYAVTLLSGDAQPKVDAAARALGIAPEHAEGGLSPEDKAARVRALDDHDTLMVGDGLNDSPSFEAALCAATPAVDRPVLPGKADFFFLGDGIAAIRRALAAARRLRAIVKQNLAIAVLYNLVAVTLCLFGLVTPVVAAVLMPLSSIAVVSLTALRLRKGADSWT